MGLSESIRPFKSGTDTTTRNRNLRIFDGVNRGQPISAASFDTNLEQQLRRIRCLLHELWLKARARQRYENGDIDKKIRGVGGLTEGSTTTHCVRYEHCRGLPSSISFRVNVSGLRLTSDKKVFSVRCRFPSLIHLLLLAWFSQLGEVKGFIRLLQDDDDTTAGQGASSASAKRSTSSPSSSSVDVFMTLPALEAFVEGGDSFLAKKERAALARRQSRDAFSSADRSPPEPATTSTKERSAGTREHVPRSRTNSWAASAVEGESDGAYGKGGEKESALLERLGSILAGVAAATSQDGDGVGGGSGGTISEDGVRGHLDSFDVDGDGVLLPEELVAALRSLGARGGEFFGRHGVNALVSRFRAGGDSPAAGTPNGASVVKLTWWFDEQGGTNATPAGSAVGHRGGGTNGVDGPVSNAPPGQARGRPANGADTQTGGVPAGETLRRAVRLAEAKGTTLERTFARLDDDGDGFITLRQLLRGLDQLGVFEQVKHTRRRACFPWAAEPVVASLHHRVMAKPFSWLCWSTNPRCEQTLGFYPPVINYFLPMVSMVAHPISSSPPVVSRMNQASRDDVLDALDELDADRQQSGRPVEDFRGEESKDSDGGRGGTGGVDLVAFIRLMRHRPRQDRGSFFSREGGFISRQSRVQAIR